ncbi:MAG: hypothetical protein M3315_09225, partial [Actinomycetota bacterium]|nr:hypothetical protein [Actinomycetota bacterium]
KEEPLVKKKLLCLAAASLVAMLILVPSAFAQEMTTEATTEVTATAPLPPTGGPSVGGPALVLPTAAALLFGTSVLTYGVVRRRR